MATVRVTLAQAGIMGAFGTQPVIAPPFRSENITSSATSASGALVARNREIASIYCDTAIVVNVGAVASQTAGIYIPAGQYREVAMSEGSTINVIDAI